MACFTAPVAAAIIATGIKKKVNSKYHLDWLITMFWGGVAMLAVEHIAHGEVVFYPPFLTAMNDPADTITMFKEIATIGTSMTIAIIAVWAIMVLVANKVKTVTTKNICG